LEIEEIKEFLKLDSSEDDSLITGLQLAAEEYLKNAGVTKNYSSELYKLVIKILISHWNENRTAVVIGSISKTLEFSLNSMIIQLQCLSGDV
jgi:uncharacterized phage protein (predicted DNA packaging)